MPGSNEYPPVVVLWYSNPDERWGATAGRDDRGALYWAPKDMNLPTVGRPVRSKLTGAYIGEHVAIEMLMWVLEPKRLCEAVTAAKWSDPNAAGDGGVGGRQLSEEVDSSFAKARRKQAHRKREAAKEAAEAFTRQETLAQCLVDEIHLLTQMCRGRSYNPIGILSKSFSYDLLMNMASNPWLPHAFRANVVRLTLAVYVDRFPQQVRSLLTDFSFLFPSDARICPMWPVARFSNDAR